MDLFASPEEFRIGAEVHKIHRPCLFTWSLSKGWLWLVLQCALSKDVPRHVRPQPNCLMVFPDCLIVSKRVTQYQLTPKWSWRTLQIYWDWQSQYVPLFGCVYHVFDVWNHVIKFKISRDTWKNIYGPLKNSNSFHSRRTQWESTWMRMPFHAPRKWMISLRNCKGRRNAWKNNVNLWDTLRKTQTWKNILLYCTRYTWGVHNENAKRSGSFEVNLKIIWILIFSRHGKTIDGLGATSKRQSFVVLRHGRTCKGMMWKVLQ